MMSSPATLEMTLVYACVVDDKQVKYLHDSISLDVFSLNSSLCFCPASHGSGYKRQFSFCLHILY